MVQIFCFHCSLFPHFQSATSSVALWLFLLFFCFSFDSKLTPSFSHFHEVCSSRNHRQNTTRLSIEYSFTNLEIGLIYLEKTKFKIKHFSTQIGALADIAQSLLHSESYTSLQSKMKKSYIGVSSLPTSLRRQYQVDSDRKR